METSRRKFLTSAAAIPALPTVATFIARPASAGTDTGWQQVVSEFKAAAAATAALPPGCPEILFETVTSAHCEKLRGVSAYPVTTIAMLREKMDMLVAEYGIDDMGSGDEFEHIYADVKRLTGEA